MSKADSLLPKAKLDLLRLLMDGEATTAALASKSGIDSSVIRRHMEKLAAAGLVERGTVKAKRGRPRTIYSLTLDGREIFFTRYDLLLEILMRVLTAGPEVKNLENTFKDAARLFATDLGLTRTLDSAIPIFQEIGFHPEVRRENGGKILISRNCPILKVAKKHPGLVCDNFHNALVGELLGTPEVHLRQAISRGASECIHQIEVRREPD